jgi:Uma2 family endonuclease
MSSPSLMPLGQRRRIAASATLRMQGSIVAAQEGKDIVSVAHDHAFGPYTVYDLDALPDEGKGYELADGWLIPLSPSPRHDVAADILCNHLRTAARAAGAKVHVQAPMDISTPAGIRKPDVGVIDRDAARIAHETKARTYYGRDVLFVAEVVSPRSGSERVDRTDKLFDYAQAGIPQYWIIDLDPHPRIKIHSLIDGTYGRPQTVSAGEIVQIESPFPFAIDPADLLDLDGLY